MLMKKVCFTGYRPEKFNFDLKKGNEKFDILMTRIKKTIISLINDGCRVFYTGMAQGFDILAAECVLLLKNTYPDIILVACLPYKQQEFGFDTIWRTRFYDILFACDESVCLNDEYSAGCFMQRNKYMVDNSDYVVCWFDGQSGGTKNTIKYAQKTGRYLINLNTDYIEDLNSTQESIQI